MEPLIIEIHNKVNEMYGYYQNKDYDKVAKAMDDVNSSTTTATSGMTILNAGIVIPSEKTKPKVCPYCNNLLISNDLSKCPHCGYPL